jgi:2'-hydroxyisoflavone reductase
MSGSKRILIIGGTRFAGYYLSEAALAAGHDVTLLHRHPTEELPGATHLVVDRDGDLSVLDGLSFDATVDMCAFTPSQVRRLGEALGGRGGHQVLVSSVSAHQEPTEWGADEDSALFDEPADDVEEGTNETYGPLKVACERVATEIHGPAGIAIVRPTYILGPRDGNRRYTHWVLRAARGGPMLAPGPQGSPMQWVDARDLGAWMLHLAEQRTAGIFIAARPPTTFGDFLQDTVSALGGGADLVTVDGDWLVEHGIDGAALPMWSEGSPELSLGMSPSRAQAAGLTHRPLPDTARDTLAWAREHLDRATNPGALSAEREQELLTEWWGTQG